MNEIIQLQPVNDKCNHSQLAYYTVGTLYRVETLCQRYSCSYPLSLAALSKEEAVVFFTKNTLRLAAEEDDHPVKKGMLVFSFLGLHHREREREGGRERERA